MPTQIQIVTITPQGKPKYAEPVESATKANLLQKPEPVIQVYPGVPPYGTPEFFEFAKALNEKLNQ